MLKSNYSEVLINEVSSAGVHSRYRSIRVISRVTAIIALSVVNKKWDGRMARCAYNWCGVDAPAII